MHNNANDAMLLAETRAILSRWAALKGHDKCWHHPEILGELCSLLGVPYDRDDPCLPPRNEFRNGCRAYEAKLYGDVP